MRTKVSSSLVAPFAFNCVFAVALFFFAFSIEAAEVLLIGADAEWRYSNTATPPPDNWKDPVFDVSAWKSGHAQLGYGDGDEATVIDGGAITPHPITAYFRKTISVTNPEAFAKLALRLIRDDGAVVYLNGKEIFRSNMPDGGITPNTLALTALGPDVENTFVSFDAATNGLVAGDNVFAVEVHQSNAESSDTSFALQVVGVISNTVNPPPETPVLSIEATRPATSEPSPTTKIASGLFTIHRSGPTNTAFTVFLTYGGTATAGSDYNALPGTIAFSEGQIDARIEVGAFSDNTVEGDETVTAELILPPTASPLSAGYSIDPDKHSALVTIHDADHAAAARIEITSPTNHTTVGYGSSVTITATAVDPNGYISRVDFYNGSQLIGTSQINFFTAPTNGTPIEHSIIWMKPPVGEHALTVHGVSSDGVSIVSQPVTIFVAVVDPLPTVVSIRTVSPPTLQALPNADYASDFFQITRTGPTNNALKVYFQVVSEAPQGVRLATPGMDYKEIHPPVEIAAGETSASIRVEAIDDTLVEGPEQVILNLVQPPANIDPPAPSYQIDSEHRQASVTILDNDVAPEKPVLSIEATRPITSEPVPGAVMISGLFTIHRGGPTNTAFTAFIGYGGTTTAGADYTSLPTSVAFKEGQVDARLEVTALSDNLVEGDETVVAELALPPTANALPDAYTIDPDKHRAVVTIQDEDKPTRAKITITYPQDHSVFGLGTTLMIKAVAVDPNGYIPRVEFYDGDNLLGVSEITFVRAPDPGTPIEHSFEWRNLPAGQHVLTARGASADNVKIVSAPVTILVAVIDPPPPPVVSIRTLSDATLRPIPNADYASDFFEVRRTGPTNDSLKVYFEVPTVSPTGAHIATPGVDYVALKPPVEIPAGQFAAYIRVEAIDDKLVEGPEQVIVKLVPASTDAKFYSIDPEHAQSSVTIVDNDTAPEQVKLAVEVADGVASELTVTDALDTALFYIKRVGGPTNIAVTAYYHMSGTASNGVDYAKLSGTVEIPAGVPRAGVLIKPIPDNVAEGEETVILTLDPAACIAIFPPPPDCYLVSDPATGRAVIQDRASNAPPTVKIVRPANGAVINVGQTIDIEAQASDHEGIISKLEILTDGKSLGSIAGDDLVVHWTDAALGSHSIVAHAVDGVGLEAKTEIHILVREPEASAFVFRKLPPAYTPGTAFTAELRAEPPPGTRAYAVEDHPPTNWTVSEISEGGAYDPTTGKVKFGPFMDTTARTLTYHVTPPSTETSRKEFSGAGSIDGASYPIGGDRLIDQSPTTHPADTDQNFAIILNEVTAYAASWKSGGDLPISYVTRAGFIWKHGEGYQFDASQQPPLCWVPLQAPADQLTASSVMETERFGSADTQPGITASMAIQITPPVGTSAYAVIERVPTGWTVTDVSDEGTFDANSATVRWGVFFDATARTLKYKITPPPAITSVARFSGVVSFDGSVREIIGRDRVISSDDASRPLIADCQRDDAGKVKLRLDGATGQISVLQSSTDLQNWEDVATLYLPDGTVEFEDNSGPSALRYYRLQVR